MDIKYKKDERNCRVVPCTICQEDTDLVRQRLCWNCLHMVTRFNRLLELNAPGLFDWVTRACQKVAVQNKRIVILKEHKIEIDTYEAKGDY